MITHNSTYYHSIPMLMSEITNAKLKSSFNHCHLEKSYYYKVNNHPLPFSKQEDLTIQSILALFVALFLLIPFCYIPAAFIVHLVKKKK